MPSNAFKRPLKRIVRPSWGLSEEKAEPERSSPSEVRTLLREVTPRSPEDLLKFDQDFEQLERNFKEKYDFTNSKFLGEGTFGEVIQGFSKERQHFVAIKNIKIKPDEGGLPSAILREVAVLQELDNAHVVKLFEYLVSPLELKLVFELLETDLGKYIKSLERPMAPRNVKYMTWQLMKGLEACHSRAVIHRDIKPQNVLIDRQLRLKLADFGLARSVSTPLPKYTHEVVTLWYRAPEILLGSALYSSGVDLWAMGCIFAEAATGHPVFAGDSEIDTLFKVFQKLGTPSEDIWPGLGELPCYKPSFPLWPVKGWANIRNTWAQVGNDGVDLLEKLLVYDPKKRISTRGSLMHVYLQEGHLPEVTLRGPLSLKKEKEGCDGRYRAFLELVLMELQGIQGRARGKSQEEGQ